MVELLEIGAGSRVADVGAGGGQWTRLLSGVAGREGRVYATEVKPAQIRGLASLARSLPASNVTVVRGTELETGLPPACCDAILLRLVYHAFDHPQPMREGLRVALRPGGRILVIDFRPPRAQLVAEMEDSGFELLWQVDAWRGQEGVYATLFGAAPGP